MVAAQLSRVRAPEWVIGVTSAALLVVLFATPWYEIVRRRGAGHGIAANGWQSLSILGPCMLLVGVLGAAVLWLQATRRAPALPASVTVFELLLSLPVSIGLVVRVLIAHPQGTVEVRYGAYLGLALTLAVLAGCYRSLRRDGITAHDAPAQIEVVRLGDLPDPGPPPAPAGT